MSNEACLINKDSDLTSYLHIKFRLTSKYTKYTIFLWQQIQFNIYVYIFILYSM